MSANGLEVFKRRVGRHTHHDVDAAQLAPCLDTHSQAKSLRQGLPQQHEERGQASFALNPDFFRHFSTLRHDFGMVHVPFCVELCHRLDGRPQVPKSSVQTRAMREENDAEEEEGSRYDLHAKRQLESRILPIRYALVLV